MTADMETSIRASRRRVARGRGALSGFLVMILGVWAAIVPFIGPTFDLAYTPRPNSAWHWTAARGWLEVLPGAAAFLGGLLLVLSSSRAMTVLGGWLGALAGAWLVIGPPLAPAIHLDAGQPDPSKGTNTQALTALLFFYAVGAALLFFASVALGRVSVLSVRDVRAAERRAEAEQAAREAEQQAALEAAERDRRARAEQAPEGWGDGRPDGRVAEPGRQPAGRPGPEPTAGPVREGEPQYAGHRVGHHTAQGGPAGANGAPAGPYPTTQPTTQYPAAQQPADPPPAAGSPPPAGPPPGGQYPPAPPASER